MLRNPCVDPLPRVPCPVSRSIVEPPHRRCGTNAWNAASPPAIALPAPASASGRHGWRARSRSSSAASRRSASSSKMAIVAPSSTSFPRAWPSSAASAGDRADQLHERLDVGQVAALRRGHDPGRRLEPGRRDGPSAAASPPSALARRLSRARQCSVRAFTDASSTRRRPSVPSRASTSPVSTRIDAAKVAATFAEPPAVAIAEATALPVPARSRPRKASRSSRSSRARTPRRRASAICRAVPRASSDVADGSGRWNSLRVPRRGGRSSVAS